MNSLPLSPTLEDYLEAIFRIASVNKVARSMDIADRLNVKRSSVTVALQSLAAKGLINYHARSFITLTENGLRAAQCVDRRHHILLDFFTMILGLSQEDADKTACVMEHGMSSEACKKMTAFLIAVKNDPASTEKLLQSLNDSALKIDCKADCGYKPTVSAGGKEAHEEELMNLNFLQPGKSGIIAEIRGSGVLKKRLLEMGIIRDQVITVVRAAPLDDPIEIKVHNAHLSLRREEASMILLKNVR